MRRGWFSPCAMVALAVALAFGAPAETAWFCADFSAATEGVPLSNVGTVNGRWQSPADAVATNACIAGEMALSLGLGGSAPVVFTADEAAGTDFRTFDIRVNLNPASLDVFGSSRPEGLAAFTFVKGETGAIDFAGIVGGNWIRLKAAGVAFAFGRWYDIRTRLTDFGSCRYAGFFVKVEGDYVPLASASGARWFRVEKCAAEAVREVCLKGTFACGGMSGARNVETPLALQAAWIGGESGEWANGANWSNGRAPAAGDLVRIDSATAIARADETAMAQDALVRVTDTGSLELLAGALGAPPTLDTSRVRAGKALKIEAPSFGGIPPSLNVVWSRGTTIGEKVFAVAARGLNYTPTVADYSHWFTCSVRDDAGVVRLEKAFYCSKLPVLYLTTDDGATPSASKEEHAGRIVAQGNGQWKAPFDGEEAMTIKVRGNSTKSWPKKPWKLKLANKAKFFGIDGKSKHWVLLANCREPSAMRNKLAADYANEIGSFGMDSTWVECVFNGKWQGLYQLSEHIRVGKGRVEIYDWEDVGARVAEAVVAACGGTEADRAALATRMSENLSWVDTGTVAYKGVTRYLGNIAGLDFASVTNDFSGGFLCESSRNGYDEEVTRFKIQVRNLELWTMLARPEYLKTSANLLSNCRKFLEEYADAITQVDGYSQAGRHWSELCDGESMVRYFLAMELWGNNDAQKNSRFFYKDRGERMKFGPVWDFDWGCGNDVLTTSCKPNGWRLVNGGWPEVSGEYVDYGRYSFYREWATDPWFCTRLWTVYWKVARPKMWELIAEGGAMDEAKAYLAEAGLADDRKWGGEHVSKVTNKKVAFTQGVEDLRTFLRARLEWLDGEFRDVPTLMASLREATPAKHPKENRWSNATNPYTADARSLHVALLNASTNTVPQREGVRVSVTIGNASVTSVVVFVNGIKGGTPSVIQGGGFVRHLPSSLFTAGQGEPNCVSFVGYNATGGCVSRNYALVWIDESQRGLSLHFR